MGRKGGGTIGGCTGGGKGLYFFIDYHYVVV